MRANILALIMSIFCAFAASGQEIYFQAHRGGMDEAPENTLAAVRHAWAIPGAVPEVDLRTTADGYIICLHDETLARTTDAPEDMRDVNVRELSLETVQKWDAGSWFHPRFEGEQVPTLSSLFEIMKEDSSRLLYLDLKDVDLDMLATLITTHGVLDRIIFVHGEQSMCEKLQQRFAGVRTMTWLSGAPRVMKRRFAQLAQANFSGISQVQFHLRGERTESGIVYDLDKDYLREAVVITKSAGVSLQVRPFIFDGASLAELAAMGIRWYVADAPAAFHEALVSGDTVESPQPAE